MLFCLNRLDVFDSLDRNFFSFFVRHSSLSRLSIRLIIKSVLVDMCSLLFISCKFCLCIICYKNIKVQFRVVNNFKL